MLLLCSGALGRSGFRQYLLIGYLAAARLDAVEPSLWPVSEYRPMAAHRSFGLAGCGLAPGLAALILSNGGSGKKADPA
jgi:hypothetical protein